MSAASPLQAPDAQGRVVLAGDWTLAHVTELEHALADFGRGGDAARGFSAAGIGKLDTAGASLLLQLIGGKERLAAVADLAPRHARLLAAVAQADAAPVAQPRRGGIGDFVAGLGACFGRFDRQPIHQHGLKRHA